MTPRMLVDSFLPSVYESETTQPRTWMHAEFNIGLARSPFLPTLGSNYELAHRREEFTATTSVRGTISFKICEEWSC